MTISTQFYKKRKWLSLLRLSSTYGNNITLPFLCFNSDTFLPPLLMHPRLIGSFRFTRNGKPFTSQHPTASNGDRTPQCTFDMFDEHVAAIAPFPLRVDPHRSPVPDTAITLRCIRAVHRARLARECNRLHNPMIRSRWWYWRSSARLIHRRTGRHVVEVCFIFPPIHTMIPWFRTLCVYYVVTSFLISLSSSLSFFPHVQVFDCRYVTTTSGMFEAICNHIKYATNKGNLRYALRALPFVCSVPLILCQGFWIKEYAPVCVRVCVYVRVSVGFTAHVLALTGLHRCEPHSSGILLLYDKA